MPVLTTAAGAESARLSGYIESRVEAAAIEYPLNLHAHEMPEWRNDPGDVRLNQWYLGELFTICTRGGVNVSRCSTASGPLHLVKHFDDGSTAELRSSFAQGGYTGVQQLRISGASDWPLLVIETTDSDEAALDDGRKMFQIGHGRIEAAEMFSDIETLALRGGEISRIMESLDRSLQRGLLPESMRIIGVHTSGEPPTPSLLSFEWLHRRAEQTIEASLLETSGGELRRRGGSVHLTERTGEQTAQAMERIVGTLLNGDSEAILALPLAFKA